MFVWKSMIAGAGEGLFASRCIPRGDVVVSMVAPGRMLAKDWDTYCAAQNHPDDSGVYHRSHVVFDRTFTCARRPHWHYMNHSQTPNTFMKYRMHNITWVALRDVGVGEELTFNYGKPDEDWARE